MKFAKHIFVLHHLAQIPNHTEVTPEQAREAWDFLFEYIHANWTPPAMMSVDVWGKPVTDTQKVEVYDCNRLLSYTSTEELEARLASLPPYYSEALFPVAVARYMLRDLQLPIYHRQLKTFKEFHDRYGSMILAY